MKSPLFQSVSGCSRVVAAIILAAGVVCAQKYDQTNLVSNAAGPAPKTDARLVNPWGLSRSSSSPWWVSDNGTGLSTLYDGTGNAQSLVVSVPGAPTGTVFNGSADFEVAPGKPARFLFASEDGTISGWNSGSQALVVVTTPGAVYKGIAIVDVNGKRQLYATDFHGGHVDVFDASFHAVTRQDGDADEDAPFRFGGRLRGLSPFGIQNIGGNLLVTYAKPDAAGHDDVHAPGNGAVAVFTPAGRLIRILEHVQDLNSPWGLALAPGDFGAFSHHLLVGQFGSGEILAYNMATGRFSGKLLNSSGNSIAIDGLWGLGFGNGKSAGPATTLYFSAGPNDEADGLFGTLTPVAAELVQGNGN
jgi:uncharacterized protein (TIGR03118 family)